MVIYMGLEAGQFWPYNKPEPRTSLPITMYTRTDRFMCHSVHAIYHELHYNQQYTDCASLFHLTLAQNESRNLKRLVKTIVQL